MSIDVSSTAFDVVAIGSSRGGIDALQRVVGLLPADFPASVLIVQHRSPRYPSFLSLLLQRVTPLAVKDAEAGERLLGGTVYVAPPDQHLTVRAGGRLVLSSPDAPYVNFTRPAIDPLFASTAACYGARAIGVVLTGMQRDGAEGVCQIKTLGGRVLVQDPLTAVAPSMPLAAIATGCVDFVLRVDELAAVLTTLVMVPGASSFFRTASRPDPPAGAGLVAG